MSSRLGIEGLPLECAPYIICTPSLWSQCSTGIRERKDWDRDRDRDRDGDGDQVIEHIDPLRMSSEAFLDRIQAIDALIYSPRDLPMPRWAYYDCVELPGALIGFCSPARLLPPHLQTALKVEHTPEALFPVSLYAAVPLLGTLPEGGRWLGHSLTAITEPREPLLAATMALAATILPAAEITGVAQWSAISLEVQARLGELEILSAWTPAHSDPTTAVFRFPTRDGRFDFATVIERGTRTTLPTPTHALFDVTDRRELERLQDQLERGERRSLFSLRRKEDGIFAEIAGKGASQ